MPLVVVLCALPPAGAAADPADLSGLDAEQLARANPIALGASLAGSVCGNPALLASRPRQATAGLAIGLDTARIRLGARPAGADVASSIYSARQSDGSAVPHVLATEDLPEARRDTEGLGREVGLLVSGATAFPRARLTFAWLAYVPLEGPAQRTFYADEREASFSNTVRFSLLEDDRGSQVIAAGLAWEPRPWIAVGAGLKVLISAQPSTRVYLPEPTAGAGSQLNMETRVLPDVVPLAGVRVSPRPWLHLGLSARPAHAVTTAGSSVVRLWTDDASSGGETVQPIEFIYDYQPARVAAAAGVGGVRWDASAEAVYRRWSGFRDHHGETPAEPFRDVVDLGVSGGARLGPWAASGGARWLRSPVPPQTGRTSFGDADRLVLGLGAGRRLAVGGRPSEIALGVQAGWLRPRQVWKDPAAARPVLDDYPDAIGLDDRPLAESHGLQTNSPGYPGYRVEGWLGSAGITFTAWY